MSVMDMWSICDRCGFKFRRRQLRAESVGWVVCNSCHDGKFDLKNHPQNYGPRPRKEPSIVPDGRVDQKMGNTSQLLAGYDFRPGTIPNNFIFTRNSAATFFNAAGTLTQVDINVPRLEYSPTTLVYQGLRLENATTNSFTNPYALGAVIGNPGVPPTNWAMLNVASGISRQIVGVGVEDGINYVDVRFTGTATATPQLRINSLSGIIPAARGQQWSVVAAWRLISGTTEGVNTPRLFVIEQNNNDAVNVDNSSTINLPTTAPLRTQIYSTTQTLTASTVNNVGVRISLQAIQSATIDITIRVALLVVSQTTTPPTIIRPPTPVVAASSLAGEITNLLVPTSATEVDILQQDVAGYAWTTVPIVGGILPVTLRAGQSHILRFEVWPANQLNPLEKQIIAEQT